MWCPQQEWGFPTKNGKRAQLFARIKGVVRAADADSSFDRLPGNIQATVPGVLLSSLFLNSFEVHSGPRFRCCQFLMILMCFWLHTLQLGRLLSVSTQLYLVLGWLSVLSIRRLVPA